MHTFTSECIDVVTYDYIKHELTIKFVNRDYTERGYILNNIPSYVFINFVNADSPGRYWNHILRRYYAD